MDNETEIQNAISKLIKGKTVLVIAHRMRTIEAADQIMVLANGTVAESGTYSELMQNKGLYRKLADGLSSTVPGYVPTLYTDISQKLTQISGEVK